MKEEMQKKLFCKIVLVTFWVMDRYFKYYYKLYNSFDLLDTLL